MKKFIAVIMSVLLILVAFPMSVVALDGQPTEPGPEPSSDYQFRLQYSVYTQNASASNVTVIVNEDKKPTNSLIDFEKDKKIEFKIHSDLGYTPRVLIVMDNGDDFDSWDSYALDDSKKVVLREDNNDYSFSFTPSAQKFFDVIIDIDPETHYWVGCEYFIGSETNVTGSVKVNGTAVEKESIHPATDTSIEFTLHSDIFKPWVTIEVFDNVHTYYDSKDSNNESKIVIEDKGNGDYSFSFTPPAQTYFDVYIDADPDYALVVKYNKQGEGEAIASVTNSGTLINPEGIIQFASGTEITLDLHSYCDTKPLVQIEIFDGTPENETPVINNSFWDSQSDSNPNQHNILEPSISEQGDRNYQLKFTPNVQNSIMVHVYWNEDELNIDNPGQDTPTLPAEEAAKAVEADRYAYSEGTDGKLDFQTKLAVEIFYESFAGDRPYHGYFASYTDVYYAIDMSSTATDTDTEIPSLSYYTCKLNIPAKGDFEASTAEFKAYVLASDTNFVVYGEKADGTKTYKVLDAAGITFDEEVPCELGFKQDSNEDPRDYVDVFGNGVCQIGGIQTSSLDIKGYHITQEHSHFCDNEFINNTRDDFSDDLITQLSFKLVVYQEGKDVIKVEAQNSAAAWNFADFSGGLSGTEDDHGFAQIFFGNDCFSIPKHSLSGDVITNIELVYPERAATISTDTNGDFTVNINSKYYNFMSFKVTYDGGTVGYIDVELVGIQLTRHDLPDNEAIYQYHGTDHCTSYTNIGESDINYIATFYYDNNATLNNDGTASEPLNGFEKVDLIVTVTKKDGKKIVNTIPNANAITQNGIVHNDFWGNQKAGLASQGNRHYYDDFLVWSGTQAEWDKLAQIEVNAVKHSDDTTFGGSMLGSGAGVGVQM